MGVKMEPHQLLKAKYGYLFQKVIISLDELVNNTCINNTQGMITWTRIN